MSMCEHGIKKGRGGREKLLQVDFFQGSSVFRNSKIQPGFSRAVLPFFPGLFQGSWKSRMKTAFTMN